MYDNPPPPPDPSALYAYYCCRLKDRSGKYGIAEQRFLKVSQAAVWYTGELL